MKYNDVDFHNINTGIDPPPSTERNDWVKDKEEEFKNLVNFVQYSLKSRVELARLNPDFDQHSMVVAPSYVMDGPSQKRVLQSNSEGDKAYRDHILNGYGPKLIFELNPLSPVVQRLQDLVTAQLDEIDHGEKIEQFFRGRYNKDVDAEAEEVDADADAEEEVDEDGNKLEKKPKEKFDEDLCKDPSSRWFPIRNTLLNMLEFSRMRGGYIPTNQVCMLCILCMLCRFFYYIYIYIYIYIYFSNFVLILNFKPLLTLYKNSPRKCNHTKKNKKTKKQKNKKTKKSHKITQNHKITITKRLNGLQLPKNT